MDRGSGTYGVPLPALTYATKRDARQVNILLVDDDDGHLALVRRALDGHGGRYRVATARTLAQARAALVDSAPDLLLVDLRLPDGVGTDLLTPGDTAQDFPVVVMTCDGSERAATEALRAGALDYLVKSPATFLDMPHIVDRALREWDNLVERREIERALRESEYRLKLAVEGTSDGLWDWNLETGVVHFAPRFHQLLGASARSLEPRIETLLSRIHPGERESFAEALDIARTGLAPTIGTRTRGPAPPPGSTGATVTRELRLRMSSGEFRWFRVRAGVTIGDHGEPHLVAGSITDIQEGKQAQNRIAQLTYHDELTGLPNRAKFIRLLEQEIVRSEAARSSFAILLLDLDRFQLVNDSLGHVAGDRMLVAIARRLRGGFSPDHVIARFGGDELMIMMREVSGVDAARAAARRVHGLLSQPFVISGHTLFVTASIGIVLSSPERRRAHEYVRDADIAMGHAKQIGKARHAVFDRDMRVRAQATLKLQNDLRRALVGNQFEVRYQPIISIEDGRITGFEALVRWRHPERGLLTPAQFLPQADETGLTIPIDRWVLQRACTQVREWQRLTGRDVTVSVNLSGHQLADASLLGSVRAAINSAGIDPGTLALEITEGVLVGGTPGTRRTIDALCELGVRLHLDDFGVGFSSLSYLHRFPIHALKIDRSFIGHLELGDREAAIVQTIIVLGRHLGMTVTAEGVERDQQLERLRELGCTHAQGYLIATPVTAEAASELLTAPGGRWS